MIIEIPEIESFNSGASVRGQWANIRWCPNASTGEVLNIGVLFNDTEGGRHVRVIDSFERVECLYDAAFASDAKFLSTVVYESLAAGQEVPAAGVFLSAPKFASGPSVDFILSTLFASTVPLGRSRKEPRPTRPRAPATNRVREIVFEELRRIAGLKADLLISSEGRMQVRDGDKSRSLDIPLQTTSALGTIISAGLATQASNELNLLRADADLQVARRLYSRDKLLMYVVRASRSRQSESMDRMFDSLAWTFRNVGVEMKTYSDPQLVAKDIVEDMPV